MENDTGTKTTASTVIFSLLNTEWIEALSISSTVFNFLNSSNDGIDVGMKEGAIVGDVRQS